MGKRSDKVNGFGHLVWLYFNHKMKGDVFSVLTAKIGVRVCVMLFSKTYKEPFCLCMC